MKNTKIFILVLILLTILSLLPFFRTDFFYTQDHIFVARLHQIHKSLLDFQFPVRWSPDLRFGEPTFNFYAPAPYYIGALFKILGLDFIPTLKLLFILSSVISAVTMFLFLRRLFNNLAGLTGAVLYVFAPYRAVDLYVRGALSEAFAFIFFPLIFHACLNLSEKVSTRNIVFLSLSLAGLFLTHNVTTLVFLPLFIAWVSFLTWKQKDAKLLIYFALSTIIGVSLSASFLLPAFFEREFIQSQYLTTGHFDFRAHFVTLGQFFSLFWGYGSSLWGPNDEMSFQVGIVNWMIVAISLFSIYINRKRKEIIYLFFLLVGGFLFSLFLQHNKSAFLWEAIPLMNFIQFPWRFLSLSVFLVAILGGLVVYSFNGIKYLSLIIILAALIFSFTYFQPGQYVNISFYDKFLQVDSMQKGVDLTKDYLPIWVDNITDQPVLSPYAKIGEVKINGFTRHSSSAEFKIKVQEDAQVVVPIAYFPGWEVKVNKRKISQNEPTNLGLINFNLPVGEYLINLNFENTYIRSFSNLISLLSIFVVALMLLNTKLYGRKF